MKFCAWRTVSERFCLPNEAVRHREIPDSTTLTTKTKIMSKKISYSDLSELDSQIAELQELYSHVEILTFGIGFCLVYILA